jgi:hypothetical protein
MRLHITAAGAVVRITAALHLHDPGLVIVVAASFTVSPLGSIVPTVIPTILASFLSAVFTSVFAALLSTFVPPLVGGFSALHGPRVVMPVSVLSGRHPNQGPGHVPGLDRLEAGLGCAGAVPAVGPAAPVPAPVEEHFLVEALHHLDPGLHHHQRRSHGQADIDVHLHLRPPEGRGED